MSSIFYDASTATAGNTNPSNPNQVVPINAAAPAATAYVRGGISQQPLNVSSDAAFMYQYVSPPLSSSSSPYTTTPRDRVSQPPTAAIPAPSFLEYAAATGQFPYYCRKFCFYFCVYCIRIWFFTLYSLTYLNLSCLMISLQRRAKLISDYFTFFDGGFFSTVNIFLNLE